MGEVDAFPFREFAIALFVGLVVGIERERRPDAKREVGGVRTFPLLALVGALSAWLTRLAQSPWILVAGFAGVCAVLLAGRVRRTRANGSGITTALAAIAVFLLGGMSVFGEPEIAVAIGVVVVALLAFKGALHEWVGKIGTNEMYAALRLLLVAFVVLPNLPDRAYDPWDAVNLRLMGWFVVVVSSVSFAGYIAVKLLGATHGLAVTGLLGGIVSSTATTLGLARRSRESDAPGVQDALGGAILLAWAVMCVRIAVIVAVVNASLLASVTVPVGAMCVAVLAVALVLVRRGRSAKAPTDRVVFHNPFSLWEATKLAAVFAAVLIGVAVVKQHLAPSAIYVVAAIAGAADVDAIVLSVARAGGDGVERAGAPAVTTGSVAAMIVIAALSNTVAKVVVAGVAGSRPLLLRVAIGAATMLVVGIASLLLV